jgi:hypothetical protein
MTESWWWIFVRNVATSLSVAAITAAAWVLYQKVLKPLLYRMRHYRRCECGHRSAAYAYIPLTETTTCLACYRAHDAASQSSS